MNRSEILAAFLTPLCLATGLAVILCVSMLCCYIRGKRSTSQTRADRRDSEVYCRAGSAKLAQPNSPIAAVHQLRSQECVKTNPKTENQLMFITETVGGGSSRPNSLSHRPSLSTIFSSIGDIIPSVKPSDADEEPMDNESFTSEPPVILTEERLRHFSQSSRKYYTLTWTSPDRKTKGSGSSCDGGSSSSVPPLRFSSTSTEHTGRGSGGRRLPSGSYQRGVASTGSGSRHGSDRQRKLSSAAVELSHILEGSSERDDNSNDISVFATPDPSNNAYYPNPNTPVSAEEEESLFRLSSAPSSYKPPLNTPTQTRRRVSPAGPGHLHSSLLIINRAHTSLYQLSDLSACDPSLTEIRKEQARLRLGSEPVPNSSPSTNNNSLSLYSQDLNGLSSAIPIHSSTIDHGTAELRLPEHMSFLNHVSDGVTEPGLHSTRSTADEDDDETSPLAEWHYNQAYEGSRLTSELTLTTVDPSGFNTDLSSAAAVHQASSGTMSNQKIPSGHTSTCPQVGSCDTSSQPSNVCEILFVKQPPFGTVYTDSTTSSMQLVGEFKGSGNCRATSCTPRAPANSPRTFVTDQSELSSSVARYSINIETRESIPSRKHSASDRLRQLQTSFTKTVTYTHHPLSRPADVAGLHEPLLSPEVYWV